MVRNGLVSNRGKSKGRKEALAYSTNEEEEDDDNVEKGQFNAAPHPFSRMYTHQSSVDFPFAMASFLETVPTTLFLLPSLGYTSFVEKGGSSS